MKKLSILFMVIFIFGLTTIGNVSAENVLFEGIFERGSTTLFERAISSKGTGHKENGKPVTQFRNFCGSSGEATLKVCNGPEAEKISSAEISINGNVVLGASNFNQNVGCTNKTVNLNDGDNILGVELKSKPGGKVSIEILQPDSPPCDGSDDRDRYPSVVIEQGIPLGNGPGRLGVAVRHDGRFVYVTNFNCNTVSVIDTSTNEVVTAIEVGDKPLAVSVSETLYGEYAYVTNQNSFDVTVIDTSNNMGLPTSIDGFLMPFGVAAAPDGMYAYVTNYYGSSLSVIDTSTNTVADTIPVGMLPTGVSVSEKPNGIFVYVTHDDDNSDTVSDNYVSVIDTSNNTETTIPVGKGGHGPSGITVTSDGALVYVTNEKDNTVSVIDTSKNTVVATIPVGDGPSGVAVTPFGGYVYVTNFNDNNVSVIDTFTNTVADTIPVGPGPSGIAVTSDGALVYVTNEKDNTVSVIGYY